MNLSLVPRNPFPHTIGDLVRARFQTKGSDTFRSKCLAVTDRSDGIFVSSGRQAFYLILAATLEAGDEVILPALSCNVLLDAIKKVGVTPVFSDICLDSLNMEAAGIESLITPRTRAVVMTHQFGYPSRADEIVRMCRAKSILVIEDAAPAFGALYRGAPVGTFGDVSFFSFERSKVISTFSGALIVGSEEILKKIRDRFPQQDPVKPSKFFTSALLSAVIQNRFVYPSVFAAWKLLHSTNSTADQWEPKLDEYGPTYEGLSEFQIALGAIDIGRMHAVLQERARAAELYRKAVANSGADLIVPQLPTPERASTYSRFPILVDDKDDVHRIGVRCGIDFGYTFSYKLSAYEKAWDRPLPNVDFVIRRILNVPITRSPEVNDTIARRFSRALSLLGSRSKQTLGLRAGVYR